MGVCLWLGRSRFTMDPQAEDLALRREDKNASFNVDLRGLQAFEVLMDACGWRLRRNAAGRVRGLARVLDKRTGDEERLFETIAPHV